MPSETHGMSLNILVKKEGPLYIAHCLELDIVATSAKKTDVTKEILDLIIAQIEYAFENDNLDNLFHSAPRTVWKEFFECRGKAQEKRIKMTPKSVDIQEFLPPWILTNTCSMEQTVHA